MGDPAPVRVSEPRTFVRQCPSTRIPLPSPAAAAACPATSGPPALRHAPRRAMPSSGTTGLSPSRAMRRTTIHPPPRRFPGIARLRATCGFPGRRWCRPHPRATADVADRALRCVDRLRCCVAAWHWVVTASPVTPSRRTLPSRQRRTWRPNDAAHSSTASPRQHQLSSYRFACRHWPECRLCAPSLPDLPRTGSNAPPRVCNFLRQPEVVTGLSFALGDCSRRAASTRRRRAGGAVTRNCLGAQLSALDRRQSSFH